MNVTWLFVALGVALLDLATTAAATDHLTRATTRLSRWRDQRRRLPGRHRPGAVRGTEAQALRDDKTMPIDRRTLTEVYR